MRIIQTYRENKFPIILLTEKKKLLILKTQIEHDDKFKH